MSDEFFKSRFYHRWVAALAVIFSPGFFISASVTCFSLFLSVSYKENIPFSNMMAIVGSIFGGIGGAFFKDEYDRLSGKNILEKKGRSALRNLQGINTQLCNIRDWVIEFSKKTRRQDDKRILEEINRHISTIELNIASGLEDWVDIVPELKEKSIEGAEIDKKYQEAARSVVIQLLESRKELAEAKDEKIELELKKKISDLEKQVKEIKKERNETFGGGISMRSGGFGGPVLSVGAMNIAGMGGGRYTCLRCGKNFNPSYSLATVTDVNSYQYCEGCQKEMFS